MNDWIFRLIVLVVTLLSPGLRESIAHFIAQLEAEAKKTDNPWDDIFVAMLKNVLLNK